jgi:hypothetical protein
MDVLKAIWKKNGEILRKIRVAQPLLCTMKKIMFLFLLCTIKKSTFSQKKSGSELFVQLDFSSISCISLPTFPFEFSVEKASNRMIDIRGLIKVLKHIQLSFIV